MPERIAFRMKVHPGKIAEYKKRHDELWPEMATALRDAGVSDYFIWHDPQTDYLFATLVRTDDHTMDKLPLYARYGVDEVLIVDPSCRGITWLRLDRATATYLPTDRSTVIGLTAADIAAQLPWERIEP